LTPVGVKRLHHKYVKKVYCGLAEGESASIFYQGFPIICVYKTCRSFILYRILIASENWNSFKRHLPQGIDLQYGKNGFKSLR